MHPETPALQTTGLVNVLKSTKNWTKYAVDKFHGDPLADLKKFLAQHSANAPKDFKYKELFETMVIPAMHKYQDAYTKRFRTELDRRKNIMNYDKLLADSQKQEKLAQEEVKKSLATFTTEIVMKMKITQEKVQKQLATLVSKAARKWFKETYDGYLILDWD